MDLRHFFVMFAIEEQEYGYPTVFNCTIHISLIIMNI